MAWRGARGAVREAPGRGRGARAGGSAAPRAARWRASRRRRRPARSSRRMRVRVSPAADLERRRRSSKRGRTPVEVVLEQHVRSSCAWWRMSRSRAPQHLALVDAREADADQRHQHGDQVDHAASGCGNAVNQPLARRQPGRSWRRSSVIRARSPCSPGRARSRWGRRRAARNLARMRRTWVSMVRSVMGVSEL